MVYKFSGDVLYISIYDIYLYRNIFKSTLFINTMEERISSEDNRPNIAIELQRVEHLRQGINVEGLDEQMEKKGLVIKEIKEGSLAQIRRKLAKDNSFIAELDESLKGVNRKELSQRALDFI